MHKGKEGRSFNVVCAMIERGGASNFDLTEMWGCWNGSGGGMLKVSD
jgi:hypothetical protein